MNPRGWIEWPTDVFGWMRAGALAVRRRPRLTERVAAVVGRRPANVTGSIPVDSRPPDMPYEVRCCSCRRHCGWGSSPDWGSAMCGPCFHWFELLLGA